MKSLGACVVHLKAEPVGVVLLPQQLDLAREAEVVDSIGGTDRPLDGESIRRVGTEQREDVDGCFSCPREVSSRDPEQVLIVIGLKDFMDCETDCYFFVRLDVADMERYEFA